MRGAKARVVKRPFWCRAGCVGGFVTRWMRTRGEGVCGGFVVVAVAVA